MNGQRRANLSMTWKLLAIAAGSFVERPSPASTMRAITYGAI